LLKSDARITKVSPSTFGFNHNTPSSCHFFVEGVKILMEGVGYIILRLLEFSRKFAASVGKLEFPAPLTFWPTAPLSVSPTPLTPICCPSVRHTAVLCKRRKLESQNFHCGLPQEF